MEKKIRTGVTWSTVQETPGLSAVDDGWDAEAVDVGVISVDDVSRAGVDDVWGAGVDDVWGAGVDDDWGTGVTSGEGVA